ncbi:hypothetical protein GCM10027185_62330 [Spirosoma pulveris]
MDDEPSIGELLKRLAQQEFPQASWVSTRSAQETWQYLEQTSLKLPQLILLDLDLRAATNGLALLAELRQHFQGRVPIIVLSATAEVADVEQAYSQGAVAYTQKPEDLSAWRAYVRLLRAYWYQASRLPGQGAGELPW